ncbi:MAG: hypothetical protein MK052_00730 [Alphaproteobacteria bacterium]|nr:hypothetical protein [Alphaproteobacteria bacterium]
MNNAPDLLTQNHDNAYEQQFIREHRKHSFFSSLYFAAAGATFIGVLGNLTHRLVQAVENDEKPFKSAKSPALMGGLMAAGVGFTYLSNKRETEKVRLEDLRLARRFAMDKPVHLSQPADISLDDNAPSTRWQQVVSEKEPSQIAR